MLIFFLALNIFTLHKPAWADDAKPGANPYIGTWRMVAVIVDGKDIAPGPSTLNTVTEEGWTVTTNGTRLASVGFDKIVKV
jgi:hypothetical protein